MSMTDADNAGPDPKRVKTCEAKASSEGACADLAAALTSWVPYDAATCDFPVQNLPYGAFTRAGNPETHLGVAIGEFVLDLRVLADQGVFDSIDARIVAALKSPVLNDLMALGKAQWSEARLAIQNLLREGGSSRLKDDATLRALALVPRSVVTMQLPARIGDYTDFYASRNHAYNVGVMFRGKDNALQPNWTWLPVGYHGRASSIVVSGTDFRRPCGQKVGPEGNPPATHGECKALDYELELGFFVGTGNNMGEPIDINDAADKLFGMVLLNDWSARDIQRWEYVPLGPFGAKNFCSTISPWVVPFEALVPFQVPLEKQDPAPLPYLAEANHIGYDITLEVSVKPKGASEATVITSSNSKYLYWSAAQMLAHHTVTGCNMQPGDLIGSGTISGKEEHEFGSMLELSWKGSKTIQLKDGVTRKMLEDGDSVTITGHAKGSTYRIGFGDCTGAVLPSILAGKP